MSFSDPVLESIEQILLQLLLAILELLESKIKLCNYLSVLGLLLHDPHNESVGCIESVQYFVETCSAFETER